MKLPKMKKPIAKKPSETVTEKGESSDIPNPRSSNQTNPKPTTPEEPKHRRIQGAAVPPVGAAQRKKLGGASNSLLPPPGPRPAPVPPRQSLRPPGSDAPSRRLPVPVASKGMSILRPKAKKERHRVTFLTWYFAGGTTTLIIALILIVRARNVFEQHESDRYMETMFPHYSLFGFVFLHIAMYAANIYFWMQYRVNYAFIFGFKKGTELGYIQVFQLAFGIAVLGLISILCNLDMEMDPKTHDYKAITELLPLMVVLFVMSILFCPFNIVYKSSRYFFLTCLFHCVCAPLYKVPCKRFHHPKTPSCMTSSTKAWKSNPKFKSSTIYAWWEPQLS